MAKKDKKKSKKKDNPGADAVGAVRTAVERTFQATADSAQSTRTRAQDLVDEVAGAAGRLREMVEQLVVLEDLKKQVDALTSRVAALEKGGGVAKSASSSRSTTSRAKSGSTARKPAAKKRAARKPAASRAKASSSGTRKTTRSSAAKKSS